MEVVPKPDSLSEPVSPALIFHSVLDGKYLIEVKRVTEATEDVKDAYAKVVNGVPPLEALLGYCGELFIFEKDEPHTLLHRHFVHLSYRAAFGPDMEDVEDWRGLAIALTDGTVDEFYAWYPDMKDITPAGIVTAKIRLFENC